jgi:hypothetical protein
MKENLFKIEEKASVNIFGKMEECMMVSGKMVNNMVEEYILRMEKKDSENGKMELELNG